MEYRNLGKSGLRVSALSYGAWVTFGKQVDVAAAKQLLATAYDAGVNFFDNAEVYENGAAEEVMGKALEELSWDRSTWCVSSKVFWGGDKPTQSGLSRKHVVEACHAALKRLRVDYLDLYFCHRPDHRTPVAETVETMTDLIRQGKVLYWGTSEWTARELVEAHGIARERNLIAPTMEQCQYNLLHRQRLEVEYESLFRGPGLGTTVWSPLASGLLTGKYNEGIPEDSRLNLEGYEWLKDRLQGDEGGRIVDTSRKLAAIADELGISQPRLALAWCLKNPNVSTVILGASKLPQLEENLKAMDDVEKLTPEVVERIEAAADWAKPEPEPSFG
ncbi:MAG: potassium channel beta subunit family protein [Verrucomicrobiota bacterium]